jgi:hypothetical protein
VTVPHVVIVCHNIKRINARPRKMIKRRGHLPSDDAATKLIWLALRNFTADWGRAAKDWKERDGPDHRRVVIISGVPFTAVKVRYRQEATVFRRAGFCFLKRFICPAKVFPRLMHGTPSALQCLGDLGPRAGLLIYSLAHANRPGNAVTGLNLMRVARRTHDPEAVILAHRHAVLVSLLVELQRGCSRRKPQHFGSISDVSVFRRRGVHPSRGRMQNADFYYDNNQTVASGHWWPTAAEHNQTGATDPLLPFDRRRRTTAMVPLGDTTPPAAIASSVTMVFATRMP